MKSSIPIKEYRHTQFKSTLILVFVNCQKSISNMCIIYFMRGVVAIFISIPRCMTKNVSAAASKMNSQKKRHSSPEHLQCFRLFGRLGCQALEIALPCSITLGIVHSASLVCHVAKKQEHLCMKEILIPLIADVAQMWQHLGFSDWRRRRHFFDEIWRIYETRSQKIALVLKRSPQFMILYCIKSLS